ncbi:MAG: hypothetical protein IKZ82_07785 [Clostridia bacterium]|nr:hypothetical protein [Clostridia bacterium]
MKIIGNTVYNDEAAPENAAEAASWRLARPIRPVPTSPFHSAYRAPGAKGLGELTYKGYSRLHSKIMRGILKNSLLSILLISALAAVIAASFLARFEGGYSDVLLIVAVPVLCFAAIVYVAFGLYNDVKSDLSRLRREKKRLSRSARARMERESGRRRLSLLFTLAATAALLVVLNAVSLA